MENRLTILEANQFSSDDRRCLYDLETKMVTIWKFFERDLPKVIKSKDTVELDSLLEKAKNGLADMKVSEVKRLYTLINEEYEESTKKEDSVRVMSISMYRSFLKHELTALNILI